MTVSAKVTEECTNIDSSGLTALIAPPKAGVRVTGVLGIRSDFVVVVRRGGHKAVVLDTLEPAVV